MTIDIGSLGSLSWLPTLSRAHLAEAQDGRMLKYFGPLAPEERGHLEQQVRFRQKLDARRTTVLDRHCTWPTELVSENGKTVGYLMRRSASFVPLLALGDTEPLAAASALVAAAAALEPLGLELGGDPRYDWGLASGAEFLACDEWPIRGVVSPFAWPPDPRLQHLAPMRRHALLGLAIRLLLDRPGGAVEGASYGEIAQACVPLWRALADAGTEAPDVGAWRRVLGLDDAPDDALLSTAISGGFADVLSMSSGRGGSRLARSLRSMALHHVLAENWPEPTRIELNGSELHVKWRWPRSSDVTGAEVQLVSEHLGVHTVVAEAFVEREGSSPGEQVLRVPSQLDAEASSVRLASASRGPEGWIVGHPLVTSLVIGDGR